MKEAGGATSQKSYSQWFLDMGLNAQIICCLVPPRSLKFNYSKIGLGTSKTSSTKIQVIPANERSFVSSSKPVNMISLPFGNFILKSVSLIFKQGISFHYFNISLNKAKQVLRIVVAQRRHTKTLIGSFKHLTIIFYVIKYDLPLPAVKNPYTSQIYGNNP